MIHRPWPGRSLWVGLFGGRRGCRMSARRHPILSIAIWCEVPQRQAAPTSGEEAGMPSSQPDKGDGMTR